MGIAEKLTSDSSMSIEAWPELGGKHDTQVTRTLPGIKGGLGNMTITEASPAWQVPSTTASGTA
jgi:hypothetical protein